MKAKDLKNALANAPEEKPSRDLENEAVSYCFDNGINISPRQATNFARHFAQWQKERMMKGAVEGKIVGLPARNDIEMQADEFSKATANFKDGDIVKLIIVKEDEE